MCNLWAGFLGTIFGAYLTQSGIDIDLIHGNKCYVEAVKQSGAIVTGTVGMKVAVKALLPEDMKEQY